MMRFGLALLVWLPLTTGCGSGSMVAVQAAGVPVSTWSPTGGPRCPTRSPAPSTYGTDPGLDEDAVKGLAKQRGISMAAAWSVLEGQRRFGLVVNTVQAHYSAAVVTVYWDWAAGCGVVQVLSTAPAADIAAIDKVVTAAGAVLTFTSSPGVGSEQGPELGAVIRRAHPGLSFSVSPSPDRQSLVVETPVALGREVDDWARAHSVKVTVRVVPDLGFDGFGPASGPPVTAASGGSR
jgi:hypothetical protein